MNKSISRGRRHTSLVEHVMHIAGTDFGGDACPPYAKTLGYHLEGKKLLRDEKSTPETQVFASKNDGFELWLGWSNEWKYHMSQREVRALFWWLFWEWYAKARWFGIRRPIYYWALKRQVRAFRKRSEPTEQERRA